MSEQYTSILHFGNYIVKTYALDPAKQHIESYQMVC